jgi:hypothetical protein
MPIYQPDTQGVAQGIDRITSILQQKAAQPMSTENMSPALLNALQAGAMRTGGSVTEGAQNYLANQQKMDLSGQNALMQAYEAKLNMGDKMTKALDDKITLFTGGDAEGKAMFLQALHEDPEDIDPTNSFKVMTKLAGIKKRTGYESPDLQMAKTKDQLDIDVKRAQINSMNALANQRNSKTGAGGGKPLPISAAKVVLENRASLDKAKRALALIEGQSIADPSGNITSGNKNATGVKGYLPDMLLQRTDPEGVPTRAAIADIGSLVIHDRSGAVVTAAEYPRLEPFIPKMNDKPEVAATKLKRFVSEYQALVDENDQFYADSGYNVPENTDRFSIVEQDAQEETSPSTQPPAGIDPEDWKFMTPEERSLFE